MPYVDNSGTKIYYETEGSGLPLVLQHGLTGSLDKWSREGYTQLLNKKYQLIMVDARGHGQSDKPHTPKEYAMKYMVSDLVAVLDDLDVPEASFWGYSMGGRIGLAIGKYAADRFNSLIIGGNGLIEKNSKEAIDELQGYIGLFKQGPEAVMNWLGEGREMESWEIKKWRNTDYEALVAYCSYYEDIGMADYLAQLSIPTFVYAGEDDAVYDGAKRLVDVMPEIEFISLAGLDHGGASKASEMMVPYVEEFLLKHFP